jgi:3-methyladenine DNA glycosylase AlkD
MENVNDIINWLNSQRNETNIAGMKRFGIEVSTAFGVKMPVLRAKAKEIKKNMELSRELWQTGFHEARMIAGFIADPKKITEKDMDDWVKDFNSWDICDVVCFGLFCKTDYYNKKIIEYSSNESEYIRRAAFAMIAGMALQNKKLPDEAYYKYLNLIEKYAFDERNFVKKAVNWALRQIGKRNISLGKKAIEVSERLLIQPHKSAHWIAKDALRELKEKWKV